MRVAPGADITGLLPDMRARLEDAETVMTALGAPELYITSGHEGYAGDGVHGPNSLHYMHNAAGQPLRPYGCAVDIRIRSIYSTRWAMAVKLLGLVFRHPPYDVVLELAPPHIHVEYDPK